MFRTFFVLRLKIFSWINGCCFCYQSFPRATLTWIFRNAFASAQSVFWIYMQELFADVRAAESSENANNSIQTFALNFWSIKKRNYANCTTVLIICEKKIERLRLMLAIELFGIRINMKRYLCPVIRTSCVLFPFYIWYSRKCETFDGCCSLALIILRASYVLVFSNALNQRIAK